MHFLGICGYFFSCIFGVLFISLIENLILGAYKLSGFSLIPFLCTCTNQMDFLVFFLVEFYFLICIIICFSPPPLLICFFDKH